jgi:hypothetical protein
LSQKIKSGAYSWWSESTLNVYNAAHEKYGSMSIDGGGSLPLNPQGVADFGNWLVNWYDGFVGYEDFDASPDCKNEILITILWIGIGYAEEAILLCKQLEWFEKNKKEGDIGIKILILGIELNEAVSEIGTTLVDQYNCNDSIVIVHADVMNINKTNLWDHFDGDLWDHFDGDQHIDIIYTSAAFTGLHVTKLLSLAIELKAVMLFSETSVRFVKDIFDHYEIEKCHRPYLLLHAELYRGANDTTEAELRKIFICKYPHTLQITNAQIFSYVQINLALIKETVILTETWFTRFVEKIETTCGDEFDYTKYAKVSISSGNFSGYINYVCLRKEYLLPLVNAYMSQKSKSIATAKTYLATVIANQMNVKLNVFLEELFSQENELASASMKIKSIHLFRECLISQNRKNANIFANYKFCSLNLVIYTVSYFIVGCYW